MKGEEEEGGGLIEEIRWNLIVKANYLFGGGKDRWKFLSYYESHECEQGFLYRIFLYGQYNAILEFGVENRFELYFKRILYILFPEG